MVASKVVGAPALVKSADPNYDANQVEAVLKHTADVSEGYERNLLGSGYLSILDAL